MRSGVYGGPFTLPPGAELLGHGQVVLTSDAPATTLTATDAGVRDVTVQGGAVGLVAANVELERVTFSGQRTAAAQLAGAVRAQRLTALASVEGIDGLLLSETARVQLSDATFSGGFRRAIDVQRGQLTLARGVFEGAKTAVRGVEAEVRLDDVRATAGSGPAIASAGGTLQVKALRVQGQEYALLLSRGAVVTATDVVARGALVACIAAEGSTLTLTGARLERCGASGALSLLNSKAVISDVTIRDASELGVLVRHGEARLSKLDVQGVSPSGPALGDALHVRDAKVDVRESIFRDLGGSGLYVSAAAVVTGGGVQIERAAQSAVFVELGASLDLATLLVRGGGGPAVLVPDAAKAKFGALSVSGGRELPIYAECDRGAQVEVQRLESTVQQLPSRCITRP